MIKLIGVDLAKPIKESVDWEDLNDAELNAAEWSLDTIKDRPDMDIDEIIDNGCSLYNNAYLDYPEEDEDNFPEVDSSKVRAYVKSKLNVSESLINESKGKKVDVSVKVPELRDGERRIIITCRDTEKSIENLIRAIQGTANPGHSFPVVIDPDDSDYCQKFFIDGDGSDYIGDITIEEYKEETEDND